MRTWDSAIYNNNHITLMKCHIGMTVFYGFLYGVVVTLLPQDINSSSSAIATGFFLLPVLLHLALSYGSYKRIEISRKVSEIVFVLLMLALPIGTLLSMFLFLPATTWKIPDEKKV